MDDLSALEALEALCFPDPWSRQSLTSHLNSQTGYTRLLGEGEAASYLLGVILPPEAEVYRIATHPQKRGMGYAKTMLLDFIKEAKNAGCNRLYLEVRASNAPARALYERVGFCQIGIRPHYYKNPSEDAILYALQWETVC